MMKWYTKYLQVYEKPFAEAPQNVIEKATVGFSGCYSLRHRI